MRREMEAQACTMHSLFAELKRRNVYKVAGWRRNQREHTPPNCARIITACPIRRCDQSRRLSLAEIRESIWGKATVALESPLSGKTHIRIFEGAHADGYEIELTSSGSGIGVSVFRPNRAVTFMMVTSRAGKNVTVMKLVNARPKRTIAPTPR